MIEEIVAELTKLSDIDQATIYEAVKLLANADGKVIELYTKSLVVHPETYTNKKDALDALRQLSRAVGRDLRYGSEIRKGEDGLLRIYELEYDEETEVQVGKGFAGPV